MPDALILAPTPDPRLFRAADGRLLSPPEGWDCLPPGDAGLTRRVKALGPSWTVIEKRGRKKFSRGVWAPVANIEAARQTLLAERADPAHARRQASAARRREEAQVEYTAEFRRAVLAFLAFAPRHQEVAHRLARAVSEQATPVGSGTVARTKRIPVEERAEAAVIAWLRHQTTEYDQMKIARVKGERRRTRQQLAGRSRTLLETHRRDEPHDERTCVLCRTLPRDLPEGSGREPGGEGGGGD